MTVDERLRRLERSNRSWRLATFVLLAAGVACQGVTSNYERIRVKELLIVDDDERTVASFVGKRSGAELSVLRQNGSFELIVDARGVAVDR